VLDIVTNASFQGEIVLIIQSIGKISTFSVDLIVFCLFVFWLIAKLMSLFT